MFFAEEMIILRLLICALQLAEECSMLITNVHWIPENSQTALSVSKRGIRNDTKGLYLENSLSQDTDCFVFAVSFYLFQSMVLITRGKSHSEGNSAIWEYDS